MPVWLLIRRNRSTRELAFYRCYSLHLAPLSALVKVAGRRWTIEEGVRPAKALCGPDQQQVRTWTSRYRWATLAMLAHAFLAAVTAAGRAQPAEPGLIPLILAELQRLMTRLTSGPPPTSAHFRHWSPW
jgi:SRSO17 transposase